MIGRAFSQFVALLNSAGGILIFALVVMINLDIFARFLFNSPIDGVTELVELSIVAIVFLQLGDAVRNGRLTRSDGLFAKIKASKPRVGHAMAALFDLAGAAFFATLVAGSVPRFVDAWERGYYAGNQGIVVIPVWPVRLIIVIGAVTVIFVFLGLVRRHLSALISNQGSEAP